jgi:multidrug efflux pump subunit AcrA (membrane-fusion protein)
MPGMTANVRILVGSSTNVLRVSNLALRFQPPGDLVDSTKVKDLAAAGQGMGGERGGRMGGFGEGEGRRGQVGSGGEGMGDRRAMMKTMRDSIMAAHGGQMSEEDLRAEMRKAFEKMPRPIERQTAPAPAPKTFARAAQGSRFGIQNNFPEYQKSAYVPVHQAMKGRVWIMNSSGRLEPVVVTTGLSDGRVTEITAESLKPGDQVVLGATSNSDVASGSTANPLAPTGARPMGGGPR